MDHIHHTNISFDFSIHYEHGFDEYDVVQVILMYVVHLNDYVVAMVEQYESKTK